MAVRSSTVVHCSLVVVERGIKIPAFADHGRKSLGKCSRTCHDGSERAEAATAAPSGTPWQSEEPSTLRSAELADRLRWDPRVIPYPVGFLFRNVVLTDPVRRWRFPSVGRPAGKWVYLLGQDDGLLREFLECYPNEGLP